MNELKKQCVRKCVDVLSLILIVSQQAIMESGPLTPLQSVRKTLIK